MRIRGRRVVLLLTGFPLLLAKDDVPDAADINHATHIDTDENDIATLAAEEMHDNDALRRIPGLPLELVALSSTSSANFVRVDDGIFDEELKLEQLNNSSQMAHNNITRREEIERSTVSDTTEFQETGMKEEKYEQAGTSSDAAHPTDSGDSTDSDALTNLSDDDFSISDSGMEEEDGEIDRVFVDYASKSAGALVLEKSPSMKGSSNLLVADKDKYAISPCADKKFVVISLSEDILVKRIRIANYERYSSHVKEFQVSGSQTMGQWVDLGTFTAEGGKWEQEFDLEEPSWARYLKFRFISHYGNEHYCTLSQISVHGSTMLQGFHEQWKEGEDAGEPPEGNEEMIPSPQNAEGITTSPDTTSQIQKGKDSSEAPREPTVEVVLSKSGEKNTETSAAKVHSAASPHPQEVEKCADEKGDGRERDNDIKEVPAAKPWSPRQLPVFDIRTASIPDALATARFELPASKCINGNFRQRRELLGTIAISSDSYGRDFSNVIKMKEDNYAVSSGSETFNSSEQRQHSWAVSDAVREIQHRIETTIGKTRELHHTFQTIIGNTLPRLRAPWMRNESEPPSKPSGGTTLEYSEVNRSLESQTSLGAEESTTNQHNYAEPSNVIVDDSTLDIKMSAGLSKVLARYPSAHCLEELDFQAFKKSHIAKAKAATGSGNTGSQAANIQPIFKTLTDEIKVLQISQNVHDQFSRALIACYQNIMIEMANELHGTHTRQEERLAKIEAELVQVQSQFVYRHVISGAIYILTLMLSMGAIVYDHVVALLRVSTVRLLELEDGPFILAILGVTFLVSTIWLLGGLTNAWRRPKRERINSYSSYGLGIHPPDHPDTARRSDVIISIGHPRRSRSMESFGSSFGSFPTE